MNGYFFKKKTSLFINIIGIIAGAFIILFAFLLFVDSELTTDIVIGSVCVISAGAIVIAFCIFSLLFNHGAYLHIREDHISAKFNWNIKIMCYYNEIAFVEYSRFSLFIRLKNGKQYTIFCLINAEILCDAIRKKLPSNKNDAVDKETLLSEIKILIAKRRKDIVWIITLSMLMFINIILCVFLTGKKDFSDFIKIDWTIFAIFAASEICIIFALFVIANKCGKKIPALNEKKAILRKIILETVPTLPGNLLSVHIDSAYEARATVYGYPNSENVYFYVETVDKEYRLICTYQSSVYSSVEELAPLLEELINVNP